MNWMPRPGTCRLAWVAMLSLAGLTACEGLEGSFGPDDDLVPPDFEARYEWVLEGWREGSVEPVGRPAVHLTWGLPGEWDGEAFRVYARRSGDSGYVLAATVTSCGSGLCLYTDLNVAPGASYDYYVATVDERGEIEVPTESALRVSVPSTPRLATPGAPTVVALDGGLYLRWAASTEAARYQVFLEAVDGRSDFFLVGETDGASFLDQRAVNGRTYAYRVAAVDSLGHVSSRSALATGTPRPDYHAEVAYAYADSAALSGFRFVDDDEADPIVSGDAVSSQWRLERTGSTFRIVPQGATRVSGGTFTTALTCGPGLTSDGERCIAVTSADGLAFGTAAVPVEAGHTYVLRVIGSDGATHYGKVRTLGTATDPRGRPILVFDWAYQLRANATSLSRLPG